MRFAFRQAGDAVSVACMCAGLMPTTAKVVTELRGTLCDGRDSLIDEIAKDNENDQSNHRVTLLCMLHLALTSCKRVGRRRSAVRFRLPHPPEGRDTPGLCRTSPAYSSTSKIQYYESILIRKVVWGLSYMDHMEWKKSLWAESPEKRQRCQTAA